MVLIVNTADWPYESSWSLTTEKGKKQSKDTCDCLCLRSFQQIAFSDEMKLEANGSVSTDEPVQGLFSWFWPRANKAPVLKSITVIPKLRGKGERSYIRATFEHGGLGEIGEAWSVCVWL